MRTLAGLAVVLLVALLVAPAASPVQISYVTSDSMEPTISTNDGYVLVPTGTVEAGDVITFYSADRETYVTHRAVSVSDEGIVTKGDGNPSTDQAAGYPPVQRSAVAGEVLTLGDSPLLVPHLGAVLSLVGTYWYAVVALLIGVVAVTAARSSRRRARDSVLRSRDVVVPAVLVSVLIGVTLVSIAAVHQTQRYQVTTDETNDLTALTVGEPRTESLTVRLASTPVTHLVTETDGMRIVETSSTNDSLGRDTVERDDILGSLRQRFLESSSRNVTVTIPPQGQPGVHATSLDVYPYPATLPRGVVLAIHGVHPLLAALATVLVGIGPLYLCYWLLFDTVAPLRRTRSRLLRRLGGSR